MQLRSEKRIRIRHDKIQFPMKRNELMTTRTNPHWLKSLVIHALALMVAMPIGLIVISNEESPMVIFCSFWLMLISPLAYPVFGPYFAAFQLCIVGFDALRLSPSDGGIQNSLSQVVVILSYAIYFSLLIGSILAKNRYVRVGLCAVLAAWFVLTLFGFSNLVAVYGI